MDNQAGSEEKNRNMVSSANYCFVDQLQSFAPNNQEIYNLTTGMEMINFPPKSLQHHHLSTAETNSAMWKEFFSGKNPAGNNIAGGCGPSSSKAASEFFHQDHHHEYNKGDFMTETTSSLLAVAPDHDYVDDSSLRCVFPCEGNERPSQGLSLSLSSANPSTIGLQSFELRQPDMFFSKSMEIQQSQEQNRIVQDGYLGKGSNINYPNGFFQIRNSKYLGPAQDLLNEFCNLGSKQKDPKLKTKTQKSAQWLDQENIGSSSSKKPPLYALEVLELQKRKTKLLSMLEEVDRRYRHYCDQMKAVVSSFEAMAGNGAASIYSEMASKAMSRHFRCLRDGIVGQIKDTKKAMGEKDTAAPGTTRGETPRLRLLDQTLRQQRAYQQMSMMESHPWRPQRGLPERSVSVLRAWLFEHFLHPYPSDVDKHVLARQTGLSRSQVSNWFINARVRLWKPMVEEMYLEETKEQDNIPSTEENIGRPNQNSLARVEDQKPTPAQLGRIDSECLSSIIINPDKNIDSMRHSHNNNKHHHQQQHHHHHHQQQHSFGRVTEPFGAVELDFSSYNHHQGFEGVSGGGTGGGGGGVSLTLGLQQHGGNGVSLAFTPATQSSLFYPRDHIEDCQTVQFSLLDGEAQNLPYRNLMGAQLLHDLAG